MRIFFKKDLLEIQAEQEAKNYIKKIQELQEENANLRQELELTQEAVNEILFNSIPEGGTE